MWIRLNRSVTLPLALKSQELQCAFCLCLSFSQKLAMSHFHRRPRTPTKMEPHNRTIWILKRGCEKLLPWFLCTGDRSLQTAGPHGSLSSEESGRWHSRASRRFDKPVILNEVDLLKVMPCSLSQSLVRSKLLSQDVTDKSSQGFLKPSALPSKTCTLPCWTEEQIAGVLVQVWD